MKRTKTALGATFTTAALLLLTTLGSCVKGDKGDTGDTGIAGTNGTNGNANVSASSVTLSQSDWSYDATNWDYYADLTYPKITQDVVDNGTVEVFLGDGAGTSWQSVPTTTYYSSTASYSFDYKYYLGGLTLFINLSSNVTFTTIANYQFKIVAIGGAQRKAHPNTNWKDYNSIKAALGNSMTEATIKAK